MTPGQDNWNVDIFETLHYPRHLSLGQVKIVKTDLKVTQAILAHKFSSAQLFQRMYINIVVEEANVECFVVEAETFLDEESSVIFADNTQGPNVDKVGQE